MPAALFRLMALAPQQFNSLPAWTKRFSELRKVACFDPYSWHILQMPLLHPHGRTPTASSVRKPTHDEDKNTKEVLARYCCRACCGFRKPSG
jgi:hypothetical protein